MTFLNDSLLQGPDGARRLRWTAYGVSCLLLLSAAWAAFSVFPFLTGVPKPTGIYRPLGPAPGGSLRAGETMMVYDVMGRSKTRRSGAAVVNPDGSLLLTRYDGQFAPKGKEEAVLLAANVRALWVMASDADREELHHAVNAFAAALGHAAQQALTSPEFENEYRPLITAAVRRAAGDAWRSPAVQSALAELITVSRPMATHFTADTLRPVMLERLQPALWATVKDNTARLWDVFSGFQFDFRQLEKAAVGAVGDPRVLREAEEAFGVVAGTPQMRALLERLAMETADRLSRDRELGDLFGRMMSDGRLAQYLSAIGDPGLALARSAPRTLAQLDEKADLNSLAADIFKSQARGQSGHIVVFMSAADRKRIQNIDPMAATVSVGEPVR